MGFEDVLSRFNNTLVALRHEIFVLRQQYVIWMWQAAKRHVKKARFGLDFGELSGFVPQSSSGLLPYAWHFLATVVDVECSADQLASTVAIPLVVSAPRGCGVE